MTVAELVKQTLLDRKLIIDIAIDGWQGKVRTGKITHIYDSNYKGGIEVYWMNRNGEDSHIVIYPGTRFEIITDTKKKGKEK